MKLYSYNHKLAESVWWNLVLLTLGGLLTATCIQSVAAPHDFLAGGIEVARCKGFSKTAHFHGNARIHLRARFPQHAS